MTAPRFELTDDDSISPSRAEYYCKSSHMKIHVTKYSDRKGGFKTDVGVLSRYTHENTEEYLSHKQALELFCTQFQMSYPQDIKPYLRNGPWEFFSLSGDSNFPWEKHEEKFAKIRNDNRVNFLYEELEHISTEDLKEILDRRLKNEVP